MDEADQLRLDLGTANARIDALEKFLACALILLEGGIGDLAEAAGEPRPELIDRLEQVFATRHEPHGESAGWPAGEFKRLCKTVRWTQSRVSAHGGVPSSSGENLPSGDGDLPASDGHPPEG